MVQFHNLETYEFVNAKDYHIYEMEKKMFQTTNQMILMEDGSMFPYLVVHPVEQGKLLVTPVN